MGTNEHGHGQSRIVCIVIFLLSAKSNNKLNFFIDSFPFLWIFFKLNKKKRNIKLFAIRKINLENPRRKNPQCNLSRLAFSWLAKPTRLRRRFFGEGVGIFRPPFETVRYGNFKIQMSNTVLCARIVLVHVDEARTKWVKNKVERRSSMHQLTQVEWK